jgi:hypothetical protein
VGQDLVAERGRVAEVPDPGHARSEHPAVCGGGVQDSEEGVQRAEGDLQGLQVLVYARHGFIDAIS